MSILLYGVGPADAGLATNDLTHGLRRQAARRAPMSTTVRSAYCLPRSRMHRSRYRRPRPLSRKFHRWFSPGGPGRGAA